MLSKASAGGFNARPMDFGLARATGLLGAGGSGVSGVTMAALTRPTARPQHGAGPQPLPPLHDGEPEPVTTGVTPVLAGSVSTDGHRVALQVNEANGEILRMEFDPVAAAAASPTMASAIAVRNGCGVMSG